MSDPTPRGPHGRRPLPARSDWRKALDVYVAGRSRVLDADEKRRLAAQAPHARGDARRVGATRPETKSGRVNVPERLEFFRNAGTWRNRLPGGDSRGGSTSDG